MIDSRLRELPSNRAGILQRSLVLATAVSAFADPAKDSISLVHTLPLAEHYAVQLMAVPTTGYKTRSDSTDVLYRQLGAQLALVQAADILQSSGKVIVFAGTALTYVQRLGLDERRSIVNARYPYLEVATALISQPGGRARLDSLEAQLLALMAWRPSDVSSEGAMSSEPVRRMQQNVEWQERVRERFASFALLGKQAPSIVANAWLNTADSGYHDSIQTRTLADGRIHVVAFGGIRSGLLPVLERLRQQLTTHAVVMFVTQTDGTIGPDIAAPRDEVAWLATYYKGKRHFTFPIAIWAGDRVPGPYHTSLPRPSPVFPAYRANRIRGVCIVDAQGIVRAYQDVGSRDQERMVLRRVNVLLAEANARAIQQQ